jgi:hypothetical protein
MMNIVVSANSSTLFITDSSIGVLVGVFIRQLYPHLIFYEWMIGYVSMNLALRTYQPHAGHEKIPWVVAIYHRNYSYSKNQELRGVILKPANG